MDDKKTNYIKFFKSFLDSAIDENETHHTDVCPFCGKKKFHANIIKGMWDCKACGEEGNPQNLITNLHALHLENTTTKDYKRLSRERHISVDTLKRASLAYDENSDRWYFPYFGPTEYLTNLGWCNPGISYRIYKALPLYPYCPIKTKGKTWDKFLPSRIHVLEGEWDSLALLDMAPDEYPVGMPGAMTFKKNFVPMFKPVEEALIIYDDDDTGLKGVAKVCDNLSSPSRTLQVCDWALMPESTEKRDTRQMLIEYGEKTYRKFKKAFVKYDGPSGEEEQVKGSGYHSDITKFEKIDNWKDYIDNYRNILYVNEETELAMQAVMSVVLTNHIEGEPLWAFLVGPASSGKTTFIESFGGLNQVFDFVSKLSAKSLVSGWRSESGKDCSLLPRINNKVLLVKDFTVVLSESHDKQRELHGILRDAYDGVLKIPQGNDRTNEYHGIKFNMIAGVTDAIHSHNDSEFGERWFKIDFLGQHYNELRYMKAAFSKLGKTRAKKEALTQCTLGFVHSKLCQVLDTHADALFQGVPLHTTEIDTGFTVPEKYFDRLAALGRFVARVSAKPKNDRYEGIVYRPRTALPTRIGLQLAKLWQGVCWVRDDKMNESTFPVVKKVMYDTCYGFTMEVINHLFENPGSTNAQLCEQLGLPSTRMHRIITDLKALKLIKHEGEDNGSGKRGRNKHALFLNEQMAEIYNVIEPIDED